MVRSGHLRVLPESRSECRDGHRPCPLVSCRYHLLLDVARDGRLFMTRDLDELEADSVVSALAEMPETCALDVADKGGHGPRQIAALLNMHVDAVEKIGRVAFETLRAGGHEFDEREHPEDPYLRYTNMGADELAEITAELRMRGKVRR